jgi:hypothetical protein
MPFLEETAREKIQAPSDRAERNLRLKRLNQDPNHFGHLKVGVRRKMRSSKAKKQKTK